MDEGAGWLLDDDTLNPVVLDREVVLSTLQAAGPLDRLFYLGLLGMVDDGLAEADRLLRARPEDPWRLLLLTGELHRFRGNLAECEDYQVQAWKYARSRSRQASTLHHAGKLWLDRGDSHTAAAHFELALTMRRGFADPVTLRSSEQALRTVRRMVNCDAIVLAGGRGIRLGGSELGAKALVRLAGWPLADHVLLAASFASTRVQVGPARIALGSPAFCLERPPGGGPVAAIAAALDRIDQIDQPSVAVLAGDLPFIGPALAELQRCVTAGPSSGDERASQARSSAPDERSREEAAERASQARSAEERSSAPDERSREEAFDVAVLVDISGRVNYLAAVWRTAALRAAVAALPSAANAPVRALYDGAEIAHVPDFDACSADVDTPDDLRSAEERIRRRSPGRLPTSPLAWPRLELHSPS
jgi:molybdopterin-guanine dinucleotide biosynthesis protein A